MSDSVSIPWPCPHCHNTDIDHVDIDADQRVIITRCAACGEKQSIAESVVDNQPKINKALGELHQRQQRGTLWIPGKINPPIEIDPPQEQKRPPPPSKTITPRKRKESS